MTIYDDMQAVAKEIFAEFKQGEIKYIKIVPGNGPADAPGAPTETPYTLVGATARGASFKYVSQSLAVATDLQVSMPVDDRFTPDINGFVEVDGKRLKVVHIDRKPAAGTPVAYVLIVGNARK